MVWRVIAQSSKLSLGTKLWVGLWAYVFWADTYAVASGQPTQTLSFSLDTALQHPKRKWMIIVAGALTVKHLFFRNICKWVDPFLGVGFVGSKIYGAVVKPKEGAKNAG